MLVLDGEGRGGSTPNNTVYEIATINKSGNITIHQKDNNIPSKYADRGLDEALVRLIMFL